MSVSPTDLNPSMSPTDLKSSISGATVGSVLIRISSSTPSFANAEASAASAASAIA
jgi:hypothetical protein